MPYHEDFLVVDTSISKLRFEKRCWIMKYLRQDPFSARSRNPDPILLDPLGLLVGYMYLYKVAIQ
jgi:hypothetical protein